MLQTLSDFNQLMAPNLTPTADKQSLKNTLSIKNDCFRSLYRFDLMNNKALQAHSSGIFSNLSVFYHFHLFNCLLDLVFSEPEPVPALASCSFRLRPAPAPPHCVSNPDKRLKIFSNS